jgi:hypothetical protein
VSGLKSLSICISLWNFRQHLRFQDLLKLIKLCFFLSPINYRRTTSKTIKQRARCHLKQIPPKPTAAPSLGKSPRRVGDAFVQMLT